MIVKNLFSIFHRRIQDKSFFHGLLKKGDSGNKEIADLVSNERKGMMGGAGVCKICQQSTFQLGPFTYLKQPDLPGIDDDIEDRPPEFVISGLGELGHHANFGFRFPYTCNFCKTTYCSDCAPRQCFPVWYDKTLGWDAVSCCIRCKEQHARDHPEQDPVNAEIVTEQRIAPGTTFEQMSASIHNEELFQVASEAEASQVELEKVIHQLRSDNKALLKAAKSKDAQAHKQVMEVAKESHKNAREAMDLREFLYDEYGVDVEKFDQWKEAKKRTKREGGSKKLAASKQSLSARMVEDAIMESLGM